jgi:hypothetical protein
MRLSHASRSNEDAVISSRQDRHLRADPTEQAEPEQRPTWNRHVWKWPILLKKGFCVSLYAKLIQDQKQASNLDSNNR